MDDIDIDTDTDTDFELTARIAQLRVVWAEALAVDTTEIADTAHFFELGGDSLLALEAADLAVHAGITMPVSGVLRYPVLSELAAAVLDPRRFADTS